MTEYTYEFKLNIQEYGFIIESLLERKKRVQISCHEAHAENERQFYFDLQILLSDTIHKVLDGVRHEIKS